MAVTNSSRKALCRILVAALRGCTQPEVERIGEQCFVVGAHIKGDGECDLGGHAGAGGVECELTDRDAHAVDSQVSEPEDARAVGDDGEADIFVRPVAEQLRQAASSIDGEVEASRPAENVAKLLAGFAHGRRVDERHEVRRVRHQGLVVESLVVVLERRQVDVSLQVSCLLAELEEDAAKLIFLGVDAFLE